MHFTCLKQRMGAGKFFILRIPEERTDAIFRRRFKREESKAMAIAFWLLIVVGLKNRFLSELEMDLYLH